MLPSRPLRQGATGRQHMEDIGQAPLGTCAKSVPALERSDAIWEAPTVILLDQAPRSCALHRVIHGIHTFATPIASASKLVRLPRDNIARYYQHGCPCNASESHPLRCCLYFCVIHLWDTNIDRWANGFRSRQASELLRGRPGARYAQQGPHAPPDAILPPNSNLTSHEPLMVFA